jgi:hypothetical protein
MSFDILFNQKYLGKFILDPSVIGESAKFRQLDSLLPKLKEKVK